MTKKCRFCGEPTTADWKIGMFSALNPQCMECPSKVTVVCQACCWVHADCKYHPVRR